MLPAVPLTAVFGTALRLAKRKYFENDESWSTTNHCRGQKADSPVGAKACLLLRHPVPPVTTRNCAGTARRGTVNRCCERSTMTFTARLQRVSIAQYKGRWLKSARAGAA